MDKKATRLEINPNAFLLYKRPGLLDAAVAGVRDVMSVQGYESNVGIYDSEEAAQANSGLEFVMQEYTGSRQVDAREYLGMLELKAQLSDHKSDRVLALTDQELSADGFEFVLGASMLDLNFSVLSLASVLKSGAKYGAQAKAVRHLARRQYAMIAGMPFDDELGDNQNHLRVYHCEDLCTLNRISDIHEVIRSADQLSDSDTAGFCRQCVSKLRNNA